MRGVGSAGWTKGKIIERFKMAEHIMRHHTQDLLDKGKEGDGWDLEQCELAYAVGHYRLYAASLVKYVEKELTQFKSDDLIACPNCSQGVATINAGQEIVCDRCETLFYPRINSNLDLITRKIAWEKSKR